MDRQVITASAEPPVQTSGDRGWDQNLASEEDRLDWLENQPSPQSSSREAHRQQLFACGVAAGGLALTSQVLLRLGHFLRHNV